MPRFFTVGGQKPVHQAHGATPGSYVANSRFGIAHGLTNSAGLSVVPDFFWAEEAAADPAETQTITITGTPTGGYFTVTFDGQTTGHILFNATAADVKTALVALSNLTTADVATSGGAFPGSAVVVSFASGVYAGKFPPLMTTTDALTGGTAPASAVTEAAFTHHSVKAVGADKTNVYCIASGDVAKIWVATA